MRVLSYLVGSQCPGQLNRHRIPQTNGFAGLADAVTVLLNSAMVGERSEHLGVPFKLSPPCVGFFCWFLLAPAEPENFSILVYTWQNNKRYR